MAGGGILVMSAPLEHEEDGAGVLRPMAMIGRVWPRQTTSDRKAGSSADVAGLGRARIHSQSTEQVADMPRLALAGRCFVARAEADPRGQEIGAAEGLHVGADVVREQGGTDRIGAGDLLQQCRRPDSGPAGRRL